jgi:8-oxo-dGTP pyrophosphatase MutT (NUDIX family)
LAGRHYVAALGVVTHGDAVLLGSHTFRRGRWGLLGGWVHRREDPAAACVREVYEETGIYVRRLAILGCDLHAIDGVPLKYGGMTIAFHCTPLDPDAAVAEPRSFELADVRWFPREEAMEMLWGFERGMIAAAIGVTP